MRFIYDIVVNYENNFFEFYEWEKEDNIMLITRHIKLLNMKVLQ